MNDEQQELAILVSKAMESYDPAFGLTQAEWVAVKLIHGRRELERMAARERERARVTRPLGERDMDELADPRDDIEAIDNREAVDQCLKVVKEREMFVISQRMLRDAPWRQIAATLSITTRRARELYEAGAERIRRLIKPFQDR